MPTARNILIPLASAVMFACIVLSLVALVHAFGAPWNTWYLVPLSALVAVESYFTSRIQGEFRLRLVELGLIYAVLEAVDTLANGGTARAALIPHFTTSTMLGFLLIFLIWLAVADMARMFPEIHKSTEPSRVVGALALRFVAGGIVLFVLAGVTQAGVARDLQLVQPTPSGPLLNVPVYFLLGMLILVYLQYESLQQRWHLQQASVVGEMGSSWLRLTAGLLLAGAIIALILPTTQTFGLLAVVAAVWKLVAGLALGIWNHLPGQGRSFPIDKLTGGQAHHHPPTPVVPPKRPHGSAPPAWWNGARTAIFWLLLTGGVLYVLSRVRWANLSEARPHPKRFSLIRLISRLWQRLWHQVRRGGRTLAALAPRAIPRRAAHPGGRVRRLLRLNALTPTEQVRYFYLSLVRRAEEQGVARGPSQTPREFAATLAPRVGEAEPDLQELTDAFVQARYSDHGIERQRANVVKASWRRVRNALRTRSGASHGGSAR